MEMNTVDYLKKALLDTQEKVRDFMHYSKEIEDPSLKAFFTNNAVEEGKQAERLQNCISALEGNKLQ